MDIKKGDQIKVIEHTTFQHLSKGTTIEPKNEHVQKSYITTVREIYTECMEDEHGNEVTETIIETNDGKLFAPEQVEKL